MGIITKNIILPLKFFQMKKLVFISGPLFFATIVIGALFKIMHWEYAGILLMVGLFGMVLIFIPALAKVLFDHVNKNHSSKN